VNIDALRAVAGVRMRRRPVGYEFGDLLSIAAIGALENPGKYHLCAAKYAIIDQLRKDRRRSVKPLPHGSLAWQERDQPGTFDQALASLAIEKLSRLEQDERTVIFEHFWNGRTLCEIDGMFGKGRTWANYKLRTALRKLRAEMGVNDGSSNDRPTELVA